MTTKRGDDPVMPTQPLDPSGMPTHEMDYGMTIREQFAMAAMQGLLASGRVLDDELTEEATMAADMQLNHLERTK